MGWFLKKTGKKKARRTRSRLSASGASAQWDPQRTLMGLKVLGIVAAVVGTGVGYRWLEGSLSDYAVRTRAVAVGVDQVVLADAPAWLSDDVTARLRRRVCEYISPNPLDGNSLKIVAKVLAGDPWVARVDQVRRVHDGRVIVEATYRQPVAVIETNRGDYLVDRQGVWLVTDDPVYQEVLPRITGATGTAGEEFSGGVPGAIALAEMLNGESYVDQITSIGISRDTTGRVQLVLYTDRSWAVWGLAPGQERSLEPSAQDKLRRLRHIAYLTGSIDNGGKGLMLNKAVLMTANPASYQR